MIDGKLPQHIQYPMMKGTIYFNGVDKATITNCKFSYNVAGPILEYQQTIGLDTVEFRPAPDKIESISKSNQALAIYIHNDEMDVKISDCTFEDNM